MIKAIFVLLMFLSHFHYKNELTQEISIYFSEYDITIQEFPKYGDTLYYNKSENEEFKFVFFTKQGGSYCERYINKILYEKGSYVNSLDTLKKYVSGRSSNGDRSPITVKEYFQPLRNGDWFFYKKGKIIRQLYKEGILQ